MVKKENNKNTTLVSKEVVIKQEMDLIFNERMAAYSASVLSDRALPFLSGLKPVHKRILWTMHQLRLAADKPHVKSLKVVGDTLGKYHPHGDSSVYGAMVNMSQDFRYTNPLVDGFGNWGSSKTPNSEAASRYTECRLSLYAQTMMEFIDKETTEMNDNYSGTEKEPATIPTLLPNILINPTSGIAVGYASSWPTHNLKEVIDANIFRIKNPTSLLKGVMKYLPAPDFPTGGIILNYQGVIDSYKTGQGKITVRGEVVVDKNYLIIKSLPYGVYLDDFLHELDTVMEKNIGVEDFNDKSIVATNGGLYNINVEIKCNKKADIKFIENYLYKNTSLQTSFNPNMMAIVDNKPVLCNLLLILDKIIASQHDILIKAYSYDLNKALIRKEIVEGLLKATKIKSVLDDIIKIIRGSSTKEEAKQKLIKKYKFTELQVNAILALRLSQLVNTDIIALENELEELKKTIAECNLVIKEKKHREEVLISKLKSYQKLFTQDRKTKIITDTAQTGEVKVDVQELISDEDRVVGLSKEGYLKLCSTKSFNSSEHWSSDLNIQDYIIKQQVVNNKNIVFCFTSLGRCLPVQIHRLKDKPWKTAGIFLSDKYDNFLPNEKMVTFISVKDKQDPTICFLTKLGMIKLMKLSSIPTTRQKFTKVMKLKPDDEIVSITCCDEKKDNFFTVTKQGQILGCLLKDITIQGQTSSGMVGCKVKNDIVVSAGTYCPSEKAVLLIGEKSCGKYFDVKDIPIANRSTKGVKVSPEKAMNIVFAVKVRIPANKDQYILAKDENDKTSWLLLENLENKKINQKMSKLSVGPLKTVICLDNIK